VEESFSVGLIFSIHGEAKLQWFCPQGIMFSDGIVDKEFLRCHQLWLIEIKQE